MSKIPAEYKEVFDRYTQDYPVDVGGFARDIGVPVYSTPLADGVSGVLVRDTSSPSGFVIHVDRDERANRQRFTAAHELGHFLFHRDAIGERVEDNYLLRSQGMSNWMEVQANKFAADLLMPRHLIERAMQSGIRTADDLADAFNVSLTAMAIRLGLPT